MEATTHTYCVYKEPKKIHVGRIFLAAVTIISLFIGMIKLGPTIMAFVQMQDAEDFCLMLDDQTLSMGEYDNVLGAGQVHPKKSAWIINHDPMKPVHVYKWTSDSIKVDLGQVHFRAPLTSDGLYEFVSTSQHKFVRLNWSN